MGPTPRATMDCIPRLQWIVYSRYNGYSVDRRLQGGGTRIDFKATQQKN